MSRHVLSPAQRILKKDFAIDSWLKGKHFRRVKNFYFETIRILAERLSAQDEKGEISMEPLRLLVAVFLSKDPSFSGFIEKRIHGSTALQTEEGWTELYGVAAGALLEKYHTAHPLEAEGKTVLTVSQVAEEVQELLKISVDRGELARQAAQSTNEVLYSAPHLPELESRLEAELLGLVEQEVLLVSKAIGDKGIPQSEKEHEIAKRALVHLRLTQLRAAAGEMSLTSSGSYEVVAGRIAHALGNDEAQIAGLVLRHEAPTPERALVTRLIALRDPPDIKEAHERVQNLTGHYMRIGIAKWFVINDVRLLNDGLLIAGTQRQYHVTPRTDDEEQLQLNAKEGAAEIEFRLRGDSVWVEVSVRKGGETKSLTAALQFATGVKPMGHLPISIHQPEGDMVTWSRETLLMLEFLHSELLRDPIGISNMKVADFEAPETKVSNPHKPEVTAVRLQGAHLLSSRQACEHIVAGRGLLGLSILISYRPTLDEHYWVPIQVEFSSEHAAIYSLLTGIPSTVTNRLHSELLSRLKSCLGRKQISPGLLELGAQIGARAKEQAPVDRADILIEREELEADSLEMVGDV